MSQESLGPLWEEPPKLEGFRVSIPKPEDLFIWATEKSTGEGELTDEEACSARVKSLLVKVTGDSEKYDSNTQIWNVNPTSGLFKDIRVTISARYSATDGGEYGELQAGIDFSEEAIADQTHWMIPRHSEQIKNNLEFKGFSNVTEQVGESSGLTTVKIPDQSGAFNVIAYLRFKNTEDALKYADPGEDTEKLAQEGILVLLDKLLLDSEGFSNSLRHFQKTLSHLIDTFHEVLGLEPPSVFLSLDNKS